MSAISLPRLAISSISRSLLLLTYLIWLFNLSISSLRSQECLARSSLSLRRSFSQTFFVFSSESMRNCNYQMSLVCDSSSYAAVASIFCIIILQLERLSWMLAVSTLGVKLALRLLMISRSAGYFSMHLIKVLKEQDMSFLTLSYSLSFSSSTVSPSLICCSSCAKVRYSLSILASLIKAYNNSGVSSCTRVRFNLNFWGLLISLNLITNSESRCRATPRRSISFYNILRVRWASTIVGVPRVCLRLLMIQLLRFLVSSWFFACPPRIIMKLIWQPHSRLNGLNWLSIQDEQGIQKYFKMEPENDKKTAEQPKPAPEQQIQTLLLQLKDTLTAIDKAVANKELRTVIKLSRQARKYRNVIQGHHLLQVVNHIGITVNENLFTSSTGFNPEFTGTFDLGKTLQAKVSKVIELEVFIKLLLVQFFWKKGQFAACETLVKELLDKIDQANKRTLDPHGALLYYYLTQLREREGNDLSIRQQLLDAYNRSCVRIDELGQCTLLNLLLRNYIRHSHFDAAHNLIEKTSFPEGKSNNEFCKYLYYTGRVKAVRREYTDALNRLNQAARKSPDGAKGFRLQCQRAAIVVELLVGDIPNREIFADSLLYSHAFPYFRLIQAVLEGSLTGFESVVKEFKKDFQRDKLYKLILRLNQIVIRIGLRKIYLAYSKISLGDIASKLNIPNEDVEFVVAKALRDGIMSGEIDHEHQLLKIEGDKNFYVTNEPQNQLDRRIKYCLNLYHETQRAITYPDMRAKPAEDGHDGEMDASELLGMFDFDDEM